jgi:hypothetical protein
VQLRDIKRKRRPYAPQGTSSHLTEETDRHTNHCNYKIEKLRERCIRMLRREEEKNSFFPEL